MKAKNIFFIITDEDEENDKTYLNDCNLSLEAVGALTAMYSYMHHHLSEEDFYKRIDVPNINEIFHELEDHKYLYVQKNFEGQIGCNVFWVVSDPKDYKLVNKKEEVLDE